MMREFRRAGNRWRRSHLAKKGEGMMREFSAGIIVYRVLRKAARYLILHYGAGHWDFPKGHIEKGEGGRDAAVRETQEETGLRGLEFDEKFREELSYFYRVKDRGLKPAASDEDLALGGSRSEGCAPPQAEAVRLPRTRGLSVKGGKGPRFKKVVFFLARAGGREAVRISHEHVGFKWLAYGDAVRRLTYENARGILKKADRFLARRAGLAKG